MRRKWLKDQETLKNEDVEITYSYWDGAGHRRVVKVRPDSLTVVEPLSSRLSVYSPPSTVQEGRRHRDFPREVSSTVPRVARYKRRQSDVHQGLSFTPTAVLFQDPKLTSLCVLVLTGGSDHPSREST